jgi:hypothetical protein
VSSPSVWFVIIAVFLFIECTFAEAAEQTPTQERGPRRRPEPRTITRRSRAHADHRRELAASCSRSRWLPRHFYPCRGDAPDTRDLFVKPGSERPFYTTVHR